MRRGKDWVWLLVVVAAAALGVACLRTNSAVLPGEAPSPPPRLAASPGFALVLRLSRTASLNGAFELRIHQTGDGADWESLRYTGSIHQPVRTGRMTAPEFAELRRALEAQGLWTIADGTEAGKGTLFTGLIVREGAREHRSTWVGLPTSQHQALARAFLDSPLGATVQEGLKSLTQSSE